MTSDFSALMAFLAPHKTPIFMNRLKSEIEKKQVIWEDVLFLANLHLCTPLLYVQLKKDGLLSLIPEELAEYLFHIYELNLERNKLLQLGLEKILQAFNEHSIESILLKGASTFCDELYEPGARVMGDLDILVPADKLVLCQNIITSLGYEATYEVELQDNGMPVDERQHHIARQVKHGTPLVVEIHYKVSHGQTGLLLGVKDVWSHCIPVEFRGYKTSMLSPAHKLLLNTAHALLPHREYLAGKISVLQWTEFAYLVHRYGEFVDWKQWLSMAKNNGLSNAFKIYYSVAIKYLQLPMNSEIELSGYYLRFNEKRLLLISRYQIDNLPPPCLTKMILFFFQLGYYIGLTKWLWSNKCYSENLTGFPKRLLFCLRKIISPNSRKHYWF